MFLIVQRLKVIVASLLVLTLTGCAYQVFMSPTDVTPNPSPGNATVTFFRTSPIGMSVHSPVAQETVEKDIKPVGMLLSGAKVTQEVAPGDVTYVVGGESSCVLTGTVEANKNYYVRIEPHIGWVRSRFSLDPVPRSSLLKENGGDRKDITKCERMELNEEGIKWFEVYKDLMKKKLANPSRTRSLNPEDGIDELF